MGTKARSRLWVFALAVTAAAIVLGLPGVAHAFSDVPAGHPYATAINELSSRGIIEGFDDGTFRPNGLVTRQQFAKMICLTLGLTVSEDEPQPFTDLGYNNPSTLYPNDYVAAAWRTGITTGVTPTAFVPGKLIPRCQVVTMTVRAIEKLRPGHLWINVSEDELPQNLNWSPWLDSLTGTDHLRYAAIAAANYLFDNIDIIGGEIEGGWVEPGVAADAWAPMPRQEVAQLLFNALELLKTLPPPEEPMAFFDDFSMPDSGWPTNADSNASMGYDASEQRYEITVYRPWLAWAAPDYSYRNFTVGVDAQAGALSPGGYGLVFRIMDHSNFYVFKVSTDGYCQLWKLAAGLWTPLTASIDESALVSDSGWNHVRVRCRGDTMAAYLNGVQVASATDGAFSYGKIGLFGEASTTKGAQLWFDDFMIWANQPL